MWTNTDFLFRGEKMAKQTFQVGIEFIANINDLQSKIKNVTGEIGKMGSTSGGTQVQKHFDKLAQSVQNLQTKAQQPITSQSEFNKLTSELNRAESEYNNLISSVERLRSLNKSQKIELLPVGEQTKIQQAAQAIKLYEQETKNTTQAQRDLQKAQDDATKAANKQKVLSQRLKEIKKSAEEAGKEYDELRIAAANLEDAQSKKADLTYKTGKRAGQRKEGVTDEQWTEASLALEQAKAKADDLRGSYANITDAAAAAKEKTEQIGKTEIRIDDQLKTAKLEARQLAKEAESLESELKISSGAELEKSFERLKNRAKELGIDLKGIDDAGQIDELKNRLMQLESQGLELVDQEIDEVAASLRGDLQNGLNSARQGLDSAASSFDNFNQQAQEVEQLKSQLGYFFSLTNSVYLLRSALQSAFETVKELDAVMTETAVVTDFTVGDMWEKLPEYAAAAGDLGSSIQDVYAATTLYYQQGLKTKAAMSVGIETMKMARIAGMEAADATQAMTAALRGFNMEVSETNALRVNDVYSNLAAITAADTEQIATAMSKTASIAASANMEFETTAALLSQIIETTQEAPETAGTALKTIIARFSEVKELQSQGLTTGQDEEGEAIDVNKIDKALKSVGISMDSFFAGTEGLHLVLLRLAEKWDTLDFTTQRYIATMAAGSRQQSRFIAMMSDYGRTTELVSAAQNSAGASQKQFGKTMESLEAKLSKLNVAWNQFTMNIADDELIKLGIDLLTGLLNTINNLTGKLPGITKSFANLGLVFVALRAGGALLNTALNGISSALSKGVINAAAEAGIVNQAAQAGARAGTAAVQGTALAVNDPASAAMLSKSYNFLFFKVKSSLPKIGFELSPNAITGARILEKELADIRREKGLLNKESEKYLLLEQAEAEIVAKLNGQYVLTGINMDQISDEQRELLANKVLENEMSLEFIALAGPELAARYAQVGAEGLEEQQLKDLAWAQQTEQNLKKGGIVGFLTEIGLRMSNIGTMKLEKGGLKELIKEKWADFTATIARNSAMLAGVAIVLAVVAAVAMLVVGLVKLQQAWHEAGDSSKKIEKVNGQIQEMQEQITESREELNKLTESKSNLEQLQETFEGLTRGTEEWKQKLVEVNGAVLDLIQEHPELAGYITKGESGQLTVRAEGWDAATAAIEQQIATAVTTQTSLQMKKNHLEQQQVLADSFDYFAKQRQMQDYWKSEETKDAAGWVGAGIVGGGVAIGGAVAGAKIGAAIGTAAAPGIGTAIGTVLGLGLGGLAGFTLGHIAPDAVDALNGTIQDAEKKATGGLTQDEFLAFAAKVQERGVTWTSGATQDEFKQIYTEMGYNESIWPDVYAKIQQMGTEFDSLAASSLELRTAQDAYMTSLVSGLAGQAGVDNSEFYDQITEIAATSGADKQGEVATEVEKILSDDDYTGKNGEAKDKLIEEYATIMNMEKDAINEKIEAGGLSSETMAQAIAQAKVDEELIAEMQRLEKVMSSLPKSAEGLKNALTSEGKDLRLGNIEEFKKTTGLSEDISAITNLEVQKKAVEDYLASQGTSLSALGLDEGNDWKLIWENFVTGSNAFSESVEKIKSWGGQLNQTVTAGAAKALASRIEEQVNTGAVGAEGVLDAISNIETNLTDEQVQQLYEALGSFDWENLSGVQSLSNALEDLGFDMNLLGGSIDFLEQKIIDFADSSSQKTTEQYASEIEKVKNLITALKEEGKGRLFTKEEAELVFGTADLLEHFISSGEGYLYKGSLDAAELINELIKDRNATEDTKKQLAAVDRQVGAQNKRQKFEFYNVKKRDQNTTKTREDGLSAKEVGQRLSFDAAAVRNSEVIKYINDQSGTGMYNMAYSNRLFGKSYAERIKESGMNEATFMANVGEDSYDNKIYQLWKMNIQQPLAGLSGKETLDEIADWYDALDKAGQDYYGAIAAVSYHGRRDKVQAAFDSVYGGLNAYGQVAAATHSTSTEELTDWEVMKGLATGDIEVQDDGSFFYQSEIGEKQLSEDDIRQLYVSYINGTETKAADQAKALGEWYNTVIEETKDLTWQAYYQEMQFLSGQEILSISEDERVDKRQEAAVRALDAQINAMTGGTEIVAKWENGLEKSSSAIAENKRAIQALALEYNSFNMEMDGLNKVLNEQVDYFEIGSEAGQLYYQALINIKNAAKSALGQHIDTNFVEDNKQLFLDLQKGGEAAQVAWEQLTEKSFEHWLEVSGQPKDDLQSLANYITSQPLQIGVATEIQGTDKLLANWDVIREGMATQGITLVKNELGQILATKSDYTGTGLGMDDKGSTEKWENPYDKFYNTLEKINEAMRQREKLERQYQRLIKKGEASANKLTEKKNQQIAALQREAELQNDIIAGRKDQINNLIKEKGLGEYAYLGKNEFTGKSELRINWAAINNIPDSEKGQEVQDYISKLEEWFGSIEEAKDSLEEIEDNTDELKERGKDEYLDLEQTIKEALIDSYQKQIDELSNINDSINDANSKMLEALQEQIDAYRQSRDNEKAENEIADKQARLAYLQQDTSGANATEILQLEKEIAEAQEGHIDNLIDQKINELQQQNDKAAEQRERQISIAEAQLEQYETSGEIWNEVNELMREGLNPDTGLVTGKKLETILKDKAGFDGMSKIERMEWLTQTNTDIASALSYLQALDGKLATLDLNKNSNNNVDLTLPDKERGDDVKLTNGMTEDEIKTLQTKLKEEGYYSGNVDGLYGKLTQQAVQNYQSAHRLKIDKNDGRSVLDYFDTAYYGNVTGKEADKNDIQETLKKAYSSGATPPRSDVPAFHAKDKNGVAWIHGNPEQGRIGTIYWKGRYHAINAYKTGGLADYTGPAWLDGTKSKPELVLNARDTQNFIQLKDILASLMTSTPKSAEKSGDMSFDIDINVESINDETDLDMIANYIENKIVSSANYRNNTIVSGRR